MFKRLFDFKQPPTLNWLIYCFPVFQGLNKYMKTHLPVTTSVVLVLTHHNSNELPTWVCLSWCHSSWGRSTLYSLPFLSLLSGLSRILPTGGTGGKLRFSSCLCLEIESTPFSSYWKFSPFNRYNKPLAYAWPLYFQLYNVIIVIHEPLKLELLNRPHYPGISAN